jgi:hypothetical protein
MAVLSLLAKKKGRCVEAAALEFEEEKGQAGMRRPLTSNEIGIRDRQVNDFFPNKR